MKTGSDAGADDVRGEVRNGRRDSRRDTSPVPARHGAGDCPDAGVKQQGTAGASGA